MGAPRKLLAVAALLLSGCATSRPELATSYSAAPIHGHGVFHTVRHGQTLWRIAHTYGLSVQELSAANQLRSTEIDIGMQLWIPRANRVVDVPPADVVQRDHKPESRPVAPVPPKPHVEVAKPDHKPVTRPVPPAVTKPPTKIAEEPADGDDSEVSAPVQPVAPSHGDSGTVHARFIWPVKGFVESPFGQRGERQHDGIDIKADKGTPIVAADAGEVLYAGEQRGYGNIVLIKHVDDLITIYAHNDGNKVKSGMHVKQGEVIAIVGQTGRATNNHLHFEVRKNRVPQDPLQFLPGAATPVVSLATHP